MAGKAHTSSQKTSLGWRRRGERPRGLDGHTELSRFGIYKSFPIIFTNYSRSVLKIARVSVPGTVEFYGR